MVNNTITAAKGFLSAGVSCGIKKSGKLDLGLLVCPTGAKASAVFTTNKIAGAPVQVSKKHIKSKKILAVVVNSGNANACTGQEGIQNAIDMCSQTARKIDTNPHNILVASTGIIGEQLPMKETSSGISKAAKVLSASAKAGRNFATAIMTTDTKRKEAVRQIKISGKKVTIAGVVKGAGMIAPNMATALLFISTDVSISKPLLAGALKGAVGDSLNKLTVDGHQSTNDTAIILASGLAENRAIKKKSGNYKLFVKALQDLCEELAEKMALDAEGATRMFKVVVDGASSKTQAGQAGRAVAEYPLVKCAVNGGDPNWGRIICALGSCGVKLNVKKLSCRIGDVTVFSKGVPRKFDKKKAAKIVSGRKHTITINLGVGKWNDFCYGCDLSREYVKINADYHT